MRKRAAYGVMTKRSILFWAVAVFLLAACPHVCGAEAGKGRIAIVGVKGIKPYQQFSNTLADKLGSKAVVKEFELGELSGRDALAKDLADFRPDIAICIGRKTYKFCDSRGGIAGIISVYNTDLFSEQNPLSALRYLQPGPKNVTAVFAKDTPVSQGESIATTARRFNFDLSVTKSGDISWRRLVDDFDAIILSEGVLIIKSFSVGTALGTGPVVAVVDRSIPMYKEMERICLSGLPPIDKVIDFSEGELESMLADTGAGLILCLGANSYQRCSFMRTECPVLAAAKTRQITGDTSGWAAVGGLSLFVGPKTQAEILAVMLPKAVTLAVPYNPESTELWMLKALLDVRGKITLVPLPCLDSGRAAKLITRAFGSYDGIWVVPDKTISVAPIQKLLLEESLRRKKILATMMHSYTKFGAVLAVSGVGQNSDVLYQSLIGLVNERLARPNGAGTIASLPESVSVNVRTAKILNLNIPKSLLNSAENVYGK